MENKHTYTRVSPTLRDIFAHTTNTVVQTEWIRWENTWIRERWMYVVRCSVHWQDTKAKWNKIKWNTRVKNFLFAIDVSKVQRNDDGMEFSISCADYAIDDVCVCIKVCFISYTIFSYFLIFFCFRIATEKWFVRKPFVDISFQCRR